MKTAETFLKEYYGIERDVENEKGLIHFDFLLKAMEEYASQLQGNKDLIIEGQKVLIEHLMGYVYESWDGSDPYKFLSNQKCSLCVKFADKLLKLSSLQSGAERGAPFDEPGCFNPAKV